MSNSQPIEITIDELQEAFVEDKVLINNTVELNTPVKVDIGIEDKVNPQQWTIKGQIFSESDSLKIVDPSKTDYFDEFPNADFALEKIQSDCSNCKDYLFANYFEEGIYIDGDIESYEDNGKIEYYVDSLGFLLSELPANIDMLYSFDEEFENKDTSKIAKGYVKTVGFGELVASDGSVHNVLKNVSVFNETGGNKILSYKIINFVSDDGYQVVLELSDTNEVNGVVNVKAIYEYLFAWQNGTTTGINNNALKDGGLTLYPNPAKEVINVNYEGNYFINDITGRSVQEGIVVSKNEKSINIASLSKGLYVLHMNGKSIRFSKSD